MHMADALISPAVGGVMWAASAGLAAYSAKKVQADLDESKVPLMGVLGAAVFAAQMINFTIPGTGSSGHLGGGLILAALLGPYAGFLVMASILTIQALFFGDGGLLALGCNIFNMGVYSCFIAYPLLFKPLTKNKFSSGRIFFGATIAAVIGLQLGAFSVVLETLFSGISDLPFGTFVLLMQPIHLAIGVVEGLITTAAITFVWKARPEIIERAAEGKAYGKLSMRKVIVGFALFAVCTGGALSWFASANPDGLEWSMFHTSGKEELEAPGGIHQALAALQEKTAFLPDYGFKQAETAVTETETGSEETWPAVNGGTSLSGLLGGLLTLVFAGMIGAGLRFMKKHA
ncbi:energy-coupling factor ABC transporter permease [Candidatus Formimonas warabiya]|uniref:Cobalamin biosynthesis protein CbiM n=1 Tax=Formimonas warabiya TaxID=1761012 RepID=A0A3G1KU83_FORW1|nr:energy-coupling factor ABC transporter permease [Candidatus Formimonas warabiya]ATW26011.1 cobalamin biosynthesis protein CbiM [Candidatus Formimonas warabiya]